MLKVKYLHRGQRKHCKFDEWYGGKYEKEKDVDLFSDLPKHRPIRKRNAYCDYNLTPLNEFIKSKVGENWDDVYSEILKKIKKKFRHGVDDYLTWVVDTPIYDKNHIPRDLRGRILNSRLFVDNNNILSLKTEEELLIDSKHFLLQKSRREKLKEILESQRSEDYKNDN